VADWGEGVSIGEVLMMGEIWRRKEESPAFELSAFEGKATSCQY
jgi:hypothetical protein